MSATFDTTPTTEQITAAWEELEALIGPYRPHREWMGAYFAASRVAIELGVIVDRLEARNELDARFAAKARALFEAWMAGGRSR